MVLFTMVPRNINITALQVLVGTSLSWRRLKKKGMKKLCFSGKRGELKPTSTRLNNS